MAKSSSTLIFSCYALCFALLLLSSQEMVKPAAALKKCYSENFRGPCVSSSNCNTLCRRSERARKGECHRDGNGIACFCYF